MKGLYLLPGPGGVGLACRVNSILELSEVHEGGGQTGKVGDVVEKQLGSFVHLLFIAPLSDLGGAEGEREGGKEGRKEGGREGGREGRKEGGRRRGRGRRGREGGREGDRRSDLHTLQCVHEQSTNYMYITSPTIPSDPPTCTPTIKISCKH